MSVARAAEGTSEAPGHVRNGFWSVVLKDVKVGSESVLTSEATAVLDTGTSLVLGPYADVGLLADRVGAHCVKFGGVSSSTVEEVSAGLRLLSGRK